MAGDVIPCLSSWLEVGSYCVVNVFVAKSEVQAAWVQAVGSIAAIVGSFALARWQESRAERRARAERNESLANYLLSVRLVCEDVVTAAKSSVASARAMRGQAPMLNNRIQPGATLANAKLELELINIHELPGSSRQAFRTFSKLVDMVLVALEPIGGDAWSLADIVAETGLDNYLGQLERFPILIDQERQRLMPKKT